MNKKILKKIEKEILSKDWVFGYERRMSCQMMYLFYSGYHTQLNKIFGTKFRDYLFRVINGNNSQFSWKTNDLKNFKNIKSKLEIEDSKFINYLSKLVVTEFYKVNKYTKGLAFNYEQDTNVSLLGKYKRFRKYQESISLPIWILFTPFEHIFVSVVEQKLKSFLKDEQKSLQILETLSLPTEIIPLDYYLKEINSIALLPKEIQEKKLAACTKKFAHLGVFDFYYPETNGEYHKQKISEVKTIDAKSFVSSLKQKYSKRSRDTSDILKKFTHDKYLHSLLSFFVRYANFKEWKNFYREQFSYKAKFLFLEISKRMNLSLEEVGFLDYDEIMNGLLRNNIPPKAEIQKRIKNSIYVFLKGDLFITTNESIISIFDDKFVEKEVEGIKGVSAYQGKVRGTVKLVISSNDFSKVNKGDILVTSTTRPDYIKVMETAGAFVTNEGGMLSHAAILAREMKKPCIIGTKIATKVLKDGDLVEVDANLGTVTILKKTK